MNKKQRIERNSKLIVAFSNPINWKPNLTMINKETGIAISTLHDFYNRLMKRNRITVWVKILSEQEVHIRKLEQELKAAKEKGAMDYFDMSVAK